MEKEIVEIPYKIVRFLEIEAEISGLVEKGTPEFDRAILDLKRSLDEGKQVLTMIKGKPSLITREESGEIRINPVKGKRKSVFFSLINKIITIFQNIFKF